MTDDDSKFTRAVLASIQAFGMVVLDPLLRYKPWKQKEISEIHQEIAFFRGYGKSQLKV